VPFAIAFLVQKRELKKTDLVFEQTLPIFKNIGPKIKIETVKYISSSNQFHDSLKNSKKQNFGSYLKFGQLPYLAQVPTNFSFSESKSDLNRISLDFYELSSTLKHENFWRNLDELPSYLDGLTNTELKN